MQTKCSPSLTRAEMVKFDLGGEVGRRLQAVTEQWIIPAPEANPAMLAMFRERDILPYRNMVPWAGEFAGKYLTHSVQILQLTGDARLKEHLQGFVNELISGQAEDGYLGCWPEHCRLTNHSPNTSGPLNWDTWSHYHAMLGLLLWHEQTNDNAALQAAVRIGDLICKKYLGTKSPRLVDTGSTEMNLAPVHSLALLYRKTGNARYLEMAEQIVQEFSATDDQGQSLAGDYLNAPLAGKKFYETPKPRWESLHPIMGLAELYYDTGKADYRQAFEQLWWSIVRGDRHNNGGFSSGEQATGNPYDEGAIETCCTVAWMAMSVEMLRLTGDSRVADELELSLLNSGLGLISPSGRWVTYNTPMDGVREASAHTIVFQSRSGAPELNCCSVNGPRVLGLLAEWGLMQNSDGLTVNYYGSGAMSAVLPSGNMVRIDQQTDYPRNPIIELSVTPEQAEEFTLALRIPYWSRSTKVWIEGKAVAAEAGSYLSLRRAWTGKTTIRIELDFQLQFWKHPPAAYFINAVEWKSDWLVIGTAVSNNGETPQSLSREELIWDGVTDMAKIRAAATVKSSVSSINFDDCFPAAGKHGAAYCFTEIEVPAATTLPIAFDCDWWYVCWVNGVKIGEGTNRKLQPYCNGMSLPLQAGRNLIEFRITGGSVGWKFNIARNASERLLTYASVYRGPILLTYDIRFNPGRTQAMNVPVLASPELTSEPGNAWLVMAGKSVDGQAVRYCDFASAGATGNYYQSWLPVDFECPDAEYSEHNPRRSQPLE